VTITGVVNARQGALIALYPLFRSGGIQFLTTLTRHLADAFRANRGFLGCFWHGNNVARRRRQGNPEIAADVDTLVSGMATADWVEIYHGYTAPELQAVIDKLKRQIDTPYDSQTEGSKSYQKNLAELRTRLQAATRVMRQKKGQAPASYAVADFSGIKV
jgi:hypothetical protein